MRPGEGGGAGRGTMTLFAFRISFCSIGYSWDGIFTRFDSRIDDSIGESMMII